MDKKDKELSILRMVYDIGQFDETPASAIRGRGCG